MVFYLKEFIVKIYFNFLPVNFCGFLPVKSKQACIFTFAFGD